MRLRALDAGNKKPTISVGSYDAPTVSSTVGVISLSALWATPCPTITIRTFTGSCKSRVQCAILCSRFQDWSEWPVLPPRRNVKALMVPKRLSRISPRGKPSWVYFLDLESLPGLHAEDHNASEGPLRFHRDRSKAFNFHSTAFSRFPRLWK